METDELRIGTAEREEAARLLADHFGMGRITPDEYEVRVTAAYAATTLGDLRPMFADLPQPHPGFFGPPAYTQATMQLPMYAPPVPDPYAPPAPMPYAPVPYSYRSKTVAGVLQIVLPFGVGRFYTGQTGLGLLQLLVVLMTGVGVIWPIVDGIMLLNNGGLDAQGRPCAPDPKRPNATLGACDAPNVALGACDAPNATLGRMRAEVRLPCAWRTPSGGPPTGRPPGGPTPHP